jgi:hypothetical protein
MEDHTDSVKAAVTAAAEAAEDSAMRWLGRDLGIIYRDHIAADALAAALPVLIAAIDRESSDPPLTDPLHIEGWHDGMSDAAELLRGFAEVLGANLGSVG